MTCSIYHAWQSIFRVFKSARLPSSQLVLMMMKRLPVCCGSQFVGSVGDCGSIDEDVTGPASAPLLVLLPRLPHHVGPQAGRQDPLELVSDFSPRLDF